MMVYIWTVQLNRDEESFWKATPRQFFAMVRKHVEYHNPKKKEETVYIDQI